jgi:hypothetical protein
MQEYGPKIGIGLENSPVILILLQRSIRILHLYAKMLGRHPGIVYKASEKYGNQAAPGNEHVFENRFVDLNQRRKRMIHRKALMLSLGSTAFVLVTAGGVYAGVTQAQVAPVATVAVEDVLNDPAVQAVLREREAAYQELIDEANQRLAEFATPTAEPTVDQYPVTAGLAAALARNALGGGALLRQPELVLFNGRVAYELIFDRGRVYVDAVSGAILYDGGLISPSASNSVPAHGHEDDDHGGGDD